MQNQFILLIPDAHTLHLGTLNIPDHRKYCKTPPHIAHAEGLLGSNGFQGIPDLVKDVHVIIPVFTGIHDLHAVQHAIDTYIVNTAAQFDTVDQFTRIVGIS